MNSREERLAHDRLEWDEWHRVTPPAEMPPEMEKIWEENAMAGNVFAEPGDIREYGEPGPYVEADFISPCVHGDVIWKGDTIRADGTGEWEHKECAQEGGPMFMERGDITDYDEDDCTPEWTI